MQQLYIFAILFIWKSVFHPFFISLTEMRFNPESERMEIAQKIFWDDLEVALGNEFDEKVDFLNPKDKAKLEDQLKHYLLKHNQVTVNGKVLTLNYLGYEIEEDAAWFYLESSSTEVPKSVEVKNTILLDDFNGQQNIVHVYHQSKSPRSLLLGKGEEKGKIEF
ncbi:DUF6702 family protein [Algoriphagus boritolerans]|uniref:Uncharacterized protein n=1 Tax=Algoriphagus boritolerans DSM 17298 = JCM 18970 TaxID=1120964 RepID=A0A1H6AM32_9BACT|nr:DUF6702 family protein [Algoriphagus boritolerans]SEG49601.1 hypothetical protein SAMN03080598_04212 [Algoriphagus boritolerans DSM 17298 = JCM 18970]